MKMRAGIAAVGLTLTMLSSLLEAQAVRVWEDEVTIPTYPLGPEDDHPHYYDLEESLIYPYTLQDQLTTERVDRVYRAFFLENEYLKIMCLPEIGGRLQYVIDKRRDEPMFYHNRVIRPGMIALRGAWVSGGVEWNRGPQGHTVTSFSPVDVVGVENDDGSASLVIGNTEMNFRTVWTVRVTLHPGQTLLDEQISLFNPTDGFHPYYFWNNTAFPNRPGTRFIFPMTLGSDHDGKEFFTWPIDADGTDLTWLRNYEAPTSIFAYRSLFDFFGAYDVDRDYGIVQVANHNLLPGKKAWTWGQAEAGLVSQSVLTDDDGPYIEVQSGPLLTQADFSTLSPGQEVTWREAWFPVFGLGQGFEFATEHAAVERIERASGVEFRVHPTRSIEMARWVLTPDERPEIIERVSLSPERTERIFVAGDASGSVHVRIEDGEGIPLLDYVSPLSVPKQTAPALEADPSMDLVEIAEVAYLRGRDAHQRMDRQKARLWYERALSLDPGHYDSLLAVSVAELEAARFDSANAMLLDAVRRAPDRGMGYVLLAVCSLHRGDNESALAYGFEASKKHGTRELGLGAAGRALMRLGRYQEAVEVFRRAYLPGGTDHVRLFEQLLIAMVAAGQSEQAESSALRAVDSGTIRLAPRAVLALTGATTLSEMARDARSYLGEDEFAFIELALQFANLGRFSDARRLLHATAVDGLDRTSLRPLPIYYLAFWSAQEAELDKAAFYIELADGLSPERVFPSRPESVAVLRFALSHGAGAGAELMLGNLFAGLGRFDEAAAHWRTAVADDDDETLSVAHRNLAMLAWKRDAKPGVASQHFANAIAARPEDSTLYRDLALLRLDQERPGEAVRILESIPRANTPRADVTVLLARSYLEASRFDDAIALLAATTFSNREGDSGTWSIFLAAHIERGIRRFESRAYQAALDDFNAALSYPTNLNVGRPAQPREARALYWKGKALDGSNREQDARLVWRECAGAPPTDEEQRSYIHRCREALVR